MCGQIDGMDIDLMDLITKILGDAAQSQFAKDCAIFALAALLHNRKMNQLTAVLSKDLQTQQLLLGKVTDRVDKIEDHLKIRGKNGTT